MEVEAEAVETINQFIRNQTTENLVVSPLREHLTVVKVDTAAAADTVEEVAAVAAEVTEAAPASAPVVDLVAEEASVEAAPEDLAALEDEAALEVEDTVAEEVPGDTVAQAVEVGELAVD